MHGLVGDTLSLPTNAAIVGELKPDGGNVILLTGPTGSGKSWFMFSNVEDHPYLVFSVNEEWGDKRLLSVEHWKGELSIDYIKELIAGCTPGRTLFIHCLEPEPDLAELATAVVTFGHRISAAAPKIR